MLREQARDLLPIFGLRPAKRHGFVHGGQLAKGWTWRERSNVPDLDVHPLVATPTVLREGNQLPGRAGIARPSGAPGRRTVDTMMAIAEAAFSTEAGAPPAARIEWLRREYVDLMSRASFRGRFYFGAGAWVVRVLAPLMIGKLRSFHRLSLSDRVLALRRFEAHPLGSILIALRAILCLLWYEHPEVVREIGVGWSERPLP